MYIDTTAALADRKSTSKSLPRVRLGVEADLPQLLEMGRELHKENGLLPLSEAKIERMARMALRQEGGIIGVIGGIGQVQAMIHLVIGSFWYTDEFHLEELYAYCRPEYRKSENSKSLIEFAKLCAIRQGKPLLIGVISNDRTEAKVRLYERRLGKKAGAWFLYGCKTGQNH